MLRKSVVLLVALLCSASLARAADVEGTLTDVFPEKKIMIFKAGEKYQSLPTKIPTILDKNGKPFKGVSEVPKEWKNKRVRVTFKDKDKETVATTVQNLDDVSPQ